MNVGYSTRIDMTGQRFGRWTVLEYAYNDKGKQAHWRCQCECGTIAVVTGRTLRAGLSKSCGCYRGESASNIHRTKHQVIDGVEFKRCSSCELWINISEFTKNNGHTDGLSSSCKSCESLDRKSNPRNKEYFREWANTKYRTDIGYKIKSSIQARIRGAIKGNYKAAKTSEFIGCSIESLKQYLESKFEDGMSWENYGEWHIDHKKPCSWFDLSDPEQQRLCFHYTNLQPLWMVDNVRKRDRWESD